MHNAYTHLQAHTHAHTHTCIYVYVDSSICTERKREISHRYIYHGRCFVLGVSPRGVVANVLWCDFVVSEFELQLCYNFHFQPNNSQINHLGQVVHMEI